MDKKRILQLAWRNFLFYLSRKIDYPLIAPDVAQVNFTFRCNLRCKMCSMYDRLISFKSQGRPYELDVESIKKTIREASEMGISYLILIGGEPFLEPRIFELISFANQFGMRGITVVSNGTLFSREMIEKIFESNLSNLSVSIDAATEETFAKIRGENVLKKIIDNLNLLNELKEKENRSIPNIVCVCTIMDQNLEELMDIVYLCKKLKISRIIFQPVVGDNTNQSRVDFSSSIFIPKNRFEILDKSIDALISYKLSSKEDFDLVANNLKHLKLIKRYFKGRLKPQEIPCYVGYNRIQVAQEGKIYFCVNQDKHISTFGDIRQDNLKDLWFSDKAKFYRNLIRKCGFSCLQWCAYRDDFIELQGIWQKRHYFKN